MVPSLVTCVPFRISLIGFTKFVASECAEGEREREGGRDGKREKERGGEMGRERKRGGRERERERERERKELTNSHTTHSRTPTHACSGLRHPPSEHSCAGRILSWGSQ